MKLLVILCDQGLEGRVRAIIDEHEVHGYTEIPEARGSGTTGRHLGTRAFPGSVCVIFTAVEADKADRLVEALGNFCDACSEGEGIRAFVLDVSKAI